MSPYGDYRSRHDNYTVSNNCDMTIITNFLKIYERFPKTDAHSFQFVTLYGHDL